MFSIIIPAYNEGEHIRGTVEAIRKNTPQGTYEIIVVDEASTDNSTNNLQAKVYRPPDRGRKGSIWSRNIGAKLAKGENLVFMDGHVYPQNSRWLVPAISDRITDGVFITGGITSFYRPGGMPSYGAEFTKEDLNLGYMQQLPTADGEVPGTSGAYFCVTKNTFFEAGTFDPGLKLWGMEDTEISIRAWLLGYKIICVPESLVAHVFAESAFKGANRPFPSRGFEYRHNQLRTAYQHLDERRLQKVRQHVMKEDPENAKRAEAFILSSPEFQSRKRWVDSRRQHDFNWYAQKFGLKW